MNKVEIFMGWPAEELVESLRKNSRLLEMIAVTPGEPSEDEVSGEDGMSVELPWMVTGEFLEDNPEPLSYDVILGNMMVMQLTSDVEDVVVNGDVDNSGDVLLNGMNGLVKRVEVAVNEHEGDLRRSLMSLVASLPEGESKVDYVLLTSFDIEMDYIQLLAVRDGSEADEILKGAVSHPTVDEVSLVACAYMPSNAVILFKPSDLTLEVSDFESKGTITETIMTESWGWTDDKGEVHTTEAREVVEHRTAALGKLRLIFEPKHASAIQISG